MTIDEQLTKAMKSGIAFQLANRSLFDEINKSLSFLTKSRIEEIVPKFTMDFAKITSLQAEIAKFRPVIESPLLELSKQASLVIIQDLSQQITELTKFTPKVSDVLAAQISSLRPTLSTMNQLAIQSHFARVSEISLLAQKSLTGIEFKEIAKSVSVVDKVRESFKMAHLGFAEQYSTLFQSLEKEQARISSYLSGLTYLPAVEFYNGSRIVRTVTLPEDELTKEEELINTDISNESGNIVESYLKHINPSLINLWRGASQALKSDNPDSVRHFITSLRELLTQVIHLLSPDDEIRTWTKAPEYFFNNRPTRRARLLYICREINHKPFDSFLEKDIDSVLASFEIFQQGTHQIEAPFSDQQLRTLQLRAESAIRFLVDISKGTSGA